MISTIFVHERMPALQLPIDLRFKDGSRPPTPSEVKARIQGVLGEQGWTYLQQELDEEGFVIMMTKSNGW